MFIVPCALLYKAGSLKSEAQPVIAYFNIVFIPKLIKEVGDVKIEVFLPE